MPFTPLSKFSGRSLADIERAETFRKPVTFYDRVVLEGSTQQVVIDDGVITGEVVLTDGTTVRLSWDATNGWWDFQGALLENVNEIRAVDGLVTDPSYTFTSDQTEGMWLDGSPRLTQEDWTAPTLLNSWVDYGAGYTVARYRKDANGTVHVQGMIKSGTATDLTTLFTLPAGYRPAAQHAIMGISAGGLCWFRVETDGDVVGRDTLSATWTSIHFSFAT